MSQSVQLDMEVLQRFKFLMEYDVMKTSSENILLEQDLGLKGKTLAPGAKPPPGFGHGANSGPKTLEELTEEVRGFMSDWTVAAVETVLTYAGIGIPVVLTANGLWMTLEIIQASKGNPDWWSLVFSILATLTAGSQAAWLKPLYKLGGKATGGLIGTLDLLYQKAKSFGGGSATGVLDDLILLFKDIKPKLPKLLNILDAGINWITKWNAKFGQKAADGTIKVIVALKGAKDWLSGIIKSMDDWFANLGKRAGASPETSKNIGGAVRWGTGIGATGYALTPNTPEIIPPQRKYADCSFCTNN